MAGGGNEGRSDWPMMLARTVAVGLVFGTIASALNVPLPWMLGPLFGAAVMSLAGLRLGVPDQLHLASRMFIGLILGASIDADTFARIGQWPLSLMMLLVGMVLIVTASTIYYIRVAGFDRLTAVAASLPGGLSSITAIAIRLGADVPGAVVGQLFRITIVVMMVPPLYMFWLGGDDAGMTRDNGPLDWWGEHVWICLLAYPAYVLGRLIRLPVAEMVGPMLMAAAFALAGYPLDLPFWLFAATFIVLGSAIGSRFYGLPMSLLVNVGRHGLVATALILAGTFLLAELISVVMDVPLPVALLAVMPGGIAEMAILAAVLGVDPVFVTFHQVFRSVVLNSSAPFLLRWMQGRKRPPGD
jgi:uncharacterized protein